MVGESWRNPGRYMRGGCYALAAYLADRSDYSLHGCFDPEGTLHHAFVADPATGQAYDGRGAVRIEGVTRFRGRASAGEIVRPVDRATVDAYAAKAPEAPSDAEIRRFIAQGGFPTLRRKRFAKAA